MFLLLLAFLLILDIVVGITFALLYIWNYTSFQYLQVLATTVVLYYPLTFVFKAFEERISKKGL